MTYDEIVDCRRALKIDGYSTLAGKDFDVPWVTPYQMASRAPDGPVLVAYNWLDALSVDANRAALKERGYLPGMAFNKVIDLALQITGLRREQLYVTQAFHLLPATRSAAIPSRDIDISFEAVTRHELIDRRVIALGSAAADACRRHGVEHIAAPHPSARGLSYHVKAEKLAHLLIA